MIQEGGERIRGTEFILCIVGPYFFIFGKLKWGTLGDRLFFLFPYLFGDLANNEIWGEKNKKHGERERERAVAERWEPGWLGS